MCGIIGIINLDRTCDVLGEQTLNGMYKAMFVQKHRGPDDNGVAAFRLGGEVECANLATELIPKGKFDGIFGFNRLSIKDLSSAGHQPMLSDDKKVILNFNGEIYNDAELREHLLNKGYVFKSTTDTEVILNLYLEYGFEEMVSMLNGMFAIAIVDLNKHKMYIARDRFGIKPLYYSVYDNRCFYASELKSIIQFEEFKNEPDYKAFNSRLVFSRASDAVLLKNVEMLEPGCFLRFDFEGRVDKSKYFNIDSYERNNTKYANINEAIEDLDTVLSKAVKRQLVSDVKVGCQVSGGIDSTIVSYYANQAESSKLKDGISIVEKCDEKEEYYIDVVGDRLNLDIHKYSVDEDFFVNNYEKMIWHHDAPIYKPYFCALFKMTKEAKKHVTVLMSGEGGDELAGGYGRFSAGLFQPFLSKLKVGAKGWASYSSFGEYEVKSDSTITNFGLKDFDNIDELIEEKIDLFNGFSGNDFEKQLKYEITQRLPESFMRQDKMSMANSIENRVPLVDNEVADFIMQLPQEMLLSFGSSSPLNMSSNPFEWIQGKFILKELLAKKFGYDFVYRPKAIIAFDERKILGSKGFSQIFYDSVLPGMKKRDLVDANQVEKWYANISTISTSELNSMWRAIGLETWCQQFLDKKKCKGEKI